MSRIQFDSGYRSYFYQCSGVVDGTRYIMPNTSGAVTIFQQGGQYQPFPAGVWVRCKPPAGSGAEPRRQADFDNNLLKIN